MKRRKRLFRFAAILLGVAAVALLELALRLAGIGHATTKAQPLVGFTDVRPLFVKNSSGDRFEIPPSRQSFFQADSFSVNKADDEFRIFCLGGSTVQGRPYSIETSFTTWLELSLRAASPDRTWKVVNCGGVSYASYRLVPILQEVLGHQPDLIIVYTGHNEFLEARSYDGIKQQPKWLRNMQGWATDLRVVQLFRRMKPDAAAPPTPIDLPAEVDALLDYQGGLAEYRRDDRWHNGVVFEYEQNILKLIELAQQANVPILFCNPVSNVRDTPPFKVELDGGFSEAQRKDFVELWELAKAKSWDDLDEKLRALQRVLAMDPRHAEAQFLKAKILEARGDIDQAKQAYLRAKDEDICPLRMLEVMHAELQRATRRHGVELVDVRATFESEAPLGIPGDQQLIDHVHPRIDGHQRIAELLFQSLVRRGIVEMSPDWARRRETLYAENYAGLSENYFPESVERLRGLQKWASGRVTRLRLPESQGGQTQAAE